MQEPDARVYSTLAVLEHFERLTSDIDASILSLPAKTPKQNIDELKHHVTTLRTLIELIDMDGNLTVAPEKLGGRVPSSSIKRLGISGELIRLRKQGKTLKELELQFGISGTTISQFFKLYDNSSSRKKIQLERTSIFDTAKQLEDLAVLIQRGIARLEGQNDDVNVKYITEMRQLIDQAAKFAEKMANYEKFERLQKAVVEILSTELPDRRTDILKKLGGAYRSAAEGKALEVQVEHLTS